MASLLRTDKEITEIYHRQVDTVYCICYSFMKNKPEAEDMVQETFLRLIASGKTFENPRHEKAWLVVTASNLCKDQLKRFYRKDEDLDDHADIAGDLGPKENPVLEAILSLPRDYKTVCISTITRAIPRRRSRDSYAVPSQRSAPGLPVPENN